MFRLTLAFALTFVCLVSGAFVPAEDRIVGGTKASIQDFPYQASLMEHGSHVCGCSIISPDFILTAAHCLDDSEAENLKVRAGSSKLDDGGVVKAVKSFKIHPFYNSDTMDYDLAVIRLASPFTFSNTIKKVDIAQNPPKDGSVGLVSGWGLMVNNGKDLSPDLKSTELTIMLRDTCTQTKYGKNIKESMYCAKGEGTDACEGDSGGPMIDPITQELIGVVSFGFDCASEQYPGVYTLVAKCLSFIDKMMKTL